MAVESIITENLDIWTSAIKTKSTSGRGSSNKLELYGIKKLRELILSLAVRGKLVPQDPDDEPAAKLLERIKAEQEQLVIDKKIKKQKPLPPISYEEKSFEIPSGWQWCRLGEVGNTNIGLTYKPSNVDTTGTPVLRSSNIQNRKIDLKDLVRVQGIQISDSSMVEEGDLLICARNGSKALVGKTAKITQLDEPMAFGAFMAIYRSQINSYVEVYLNSPIYRSRLEGTSTTTINQITQNNLKLTECPVPPPEEQKRIVSKVDKLMALCDQLESQTEASIEAHQTLVKSLLETLTNAKDTDELNESWQRISAHFDVLFTTEESIDQLKQTILQLAVMGKLVKQDPNDEPPAKLFERIECDRNSRIKQKEIQKPKKLVVHERLQLASPKNWEKLLLNDLVFVTKLAGFEYTKHFDLKDEGDVPVVRAQNVRPFQASMENLKYIDRVTSESLPRSALDREALLVTFIGAGIGDVCVFKEPERWHLAPNVAKIEPFADLNLDYLCLYLNSPVGRKELFKSMKSTAQPSLSMTTIREIWVPIPPIEEQSRIVKKVKNTFTLCDKLIDKIIKNRNSKIEFTDSVVIGISSSFKEKA